jgi:site-specific DNA recombinase
MKTAIVYCRVSTAKQEEDGTSLQSQATACSKHADSLGYSVLRVTQEVYTGAELWDRPKLAHDRADIKAGKCHALIAYATDRLSRDPIHLAIIAEECERAGAELIFVTEPLDSSPEGALIRYVKGYASSIEREKIRERQLRGKRTRLLNGKIHNHGSDLYGYRRDRERGVREVNESEAATVRLIFRWIGEEGLSVRSLVKRLNDTGVPTPSTGKMTYKDGRTSRWGTGVIHRILRNPAYKGVTIEWRLSGHGGKRNPTERPPEEWIELPEGTTPAIVTPALWAAVQSRLATNTGDTTRNTTNFYLLRGLIYCSVCGQKMRQNIENGTRRVYRCYSRETPSGPCGGKRVPADAVEDEVWNSVAARLHNPAVIAAEVKRLNESGPDSVMLGDL